MNKNIQLLVKQRGFPSAKLKDIALNPETYCSKIKMEKDKLESLSLIEKLRNIGFVTESSSHKLEKNKHYCFLTKYTDKIDGFPVEYSYKFCSECKREMEKKAVILDSVENHAVIISFDD